jgi:hypothetical protein
MAALSFPLTCWLGLLDVGTINEITQPSYARQPATLAYCADGVTIANLAAVQWRAAGEDWGNVDAVDVWDAPTAGTLLVSLLTTEVLAVPKYAIARIPPAGLQMVQIPALRGFGTGRFGTGGFATGTGLGPVSIGPPPVSTSIPTPYGMGLYGAGPYAGEAQGSNPSAYGAGPYGAGPYSATAAPVAPVKGIILQITFDTSVHTCEPGEWTPGPFAMAA